MIGAARAVDLLSRRELTAEGLVEQCLSRIAEREPAVQAWEVLDADGALREARQIDGLRERPPLCGLPVGIKDLIDTSDLPTAYGSPIYRGHRPAADAECVRALRWAGAVVLGKTVTTEFAVYSPGKTRNPRDPSRTPGGSSSGSAAAVADGMVPLALGTQTAGSVVRPASFCGVIGWKSTFGALPMAGVRPMAPSLDTLGFFVRELEDVPVALSALGAPLRPRPPESRPVFGLCKTETWDRAEPSTRSAVEAAAARLQRAGLEVREVQLGASFAGLVDAQIAIMGAEAAASLRFELEQRSSELSPRLREFLQTGRAVPAERLQAARERAERCRAELDAIFVGVSALLTTAAGGEAPLGVSATGDPLFCRIWTLLHTPCVSLPVLRGPAGLPLGLQLVGPRGRDEILFAAAERACGAMLEG
ncbi:MAG TPA: amidase [Myxococcales bacterium]|jgi:Asp-tRNA(Asn)/Glu-tRNA(Gln) amidotransferase A subunit family amidase|nr:amidase [Myxococcales bacterium]